MYILAGLAAENARERVAAKVVLSATTLQELRENPVVLSVGRAGKYKNHAVTVIGFEGSDFIIADNWSRYPQRLAYSDIDIGATINYMG